MLDVYPVADSLPGEKPTRPRNRLLWENRTAGNGAALVGRVVKLMGDGALVEFGSVVDAVACAVAVQQGVAARQEDASTESRIMFRIGINLGDVVAEGGDLLLRASTTASLRSTSIE